MAWDGGCIAGRPGDVEEGTLAARGVRGEKTGDVAAAAVGPLRGTCEQEFAGGGYAARILRRAAVAMGAGAQCGTKAVPSAQCEPPVPAEPPPDEEFVVPVPPEPPPDGARAGGKQTTGCGDSGLGPLVLRYVRRRQELAEALAVQAEGRAGDGCRGDGQWEVLMGCYGFSAGKQETGGAEPDDGTPAVREECAMADAGDCAESRWTAPQAGASVQSARRRQTAAREDWSAHTAGCENSAARGVDRDGEWYPLVRPRAEKVAETVANDTVSADAEWIRRRAVPPIQWQPPRTRVIPVRLEKMFSGQMPYPHELPGPGREGLWQQVVEWCEAYESEWRLVELGKQPGHTPHRFNVEKIPGGRGGLILKDFLDPAYADWVWDLRPWLESGAVRGKGPRCVPMAPVSAQSNSDWRLAPLAEDAAGINYTDENIVFEACVCGIRSHSSELEENTTVLMPNYAGFWKDGAPEFVQGKSDEDRLHFARPRLTGGYKYPAFMNARVHPRGVAVQYNSETGEVKMRLTADEGAPRPPHGSQWDEGESVAWNDGIDLADPELYPELKFANVDKYAKGLAVLASSGIPIGQCKTDIRGYYRQLSRYWREHGAGQQWCTFKNKIEQDSRLNFGARGNPNTASRVTGLLWSLIEVEIDSAQAAWEAQGRVPVAERAKLEAWAADRRRAMAEHWAAELERLQQTCASDAEAREELAELRHGEGRADRWFTGNFYVDDLFAGAFDFFVEEVLECMMRVLARYNVEAADGRFSLWKGDYIANKTELCRAAEECGGAMEVLGVLLDPVSGRRSITEFRAKRYVAGGKTLLGQRVANRTVLQSWLGKVIFASCAIPALRAGFQALLATLRQGWSSQNAVAMGSTAWEQIKMICALLVSGRGCALWPNRLPMGSGERRLVWTFGDAARDPLAPHEQFVGYGLWFWVEGEETAHVRVGRWSKWEQQLCPTSLELHTANMVMAWALSEKPAGEDWDVIQVTDSSSAKDVAMRVHARSAAERMLLQRRGEMLAEHAGSRCAVVHAHREFLQDCDDGSKGKLSSMIDLLQQRFDGAVGVRSGGRMPPEWRALEAVVEAKAAAEESPRGRKARGSRGSKRREASASV